MGSLFLYKTAILLDMFDITAFVQAAGYVGLTAVVFAESGLLIGFFLPGDSLIFTAGFLASQGYLNVYLLAGLLFVAAVVGDNVGYTFGKRVGPRIFKREDSLFFHKDHVKRAEKFFAQYGAKTIVFARFVPVVRTFAPILAGVGNMPYRVFVTYNIFGGLLWAVGLTFLGFFLGNLIPNIDQYLLPIIAGIIVLSILPNIYHIIKARYGK